MWDICATRSRFVTHAFFLSLTHCLAARLKVLKDATNHFSSSTVANLPFVIPAMDHIDTLFTKAIQTSSNKPIAIRAAIHIAKKTLNRYYSLTDSAEVYRIAMGTLPFHFCFCLGH